MDTIQLEKYFSVKLLQDKNLLYSKVNGSITHDQFKAAMLHVVDLLKKHQLNFWLIDATASSFTLQDQRWAAETLGALVQETPIKRIAMVRNDDLFLEMAAENMRYKIYELFGNTIELEHFATVPEALEWLAPGHTSLLSI